MARKRRMLADGPRYPKVVETFWVPFDVDHAQDEPSTFNGFVRIRKFKITVELVDEPVEVLRDRLRKLWRETERNSHHWAPMQQVAAELGMADDDLKVSEQGIDWLAAQEARAAEGKA